MFNMAMGLLQAGGPSPFPVSSGQAIAQGSQHAMQQRRALEQSQYQKAIASSQLMNAMSRGGGGQGSGNQGIDFGTYNPRDYTTESWAKFVRTRDPSVLERYERIAWLDAGGGRKVPYDPVTGEKLGEPISADEYANQKARVAATERAATDAASASVKASVEAPKKIREAEQKIDELDSIMLPALDEAIELVGNRSAGYGAAIFESWPESDARLLRAKIENIQSRLSVDTMMMMKAASATGSTGFGALSEKELKVIQDRIATLDRLSSPPELKKQLQTIKQQMLKWRELYLEDIALIKAGLRQPAAAKASGPKTAEDYLKAAGAQ